MDDVPLIKRLLQHQSDFMAYLMAITRDFQAAEEIFQNTALVVIEKSAEADLTIHDFRAWAKEIVRRQALHYMRNEDKTATRMRPIEPSLLEQVTKVFLEDEQGEGQRLREIRALRSCIAEMSGPQRQMLAMRYERQASFTAIAEAVDKTEAAVQRALSRLRRSLYNCVQAKLVWNEVR